MKLLEVLPLLEARKNPEQNPKNSAYQQLLKYKDNPNVYISMTTVPKLGLNPLSKWDTPLGIYCYPLQAVWDVYKFDTYKNLDNLPFVGTAPYIQVLEWNGNGKFLDVADYNETDLKQDIKQLWNIYEDYPDTISIAIEEARVEHKDSIPARVFFKICLSLSGREKGSVEKEVWDSRTKKTVKEVTFSKGGRKWNSLLRKLGYAGFSDKTGEGVIHPNEPIQAFFLSMEYVKQLEQIENKDYQMYSTPYIPRMVLGGKATNVVVDGKEFIIAPEITRKQSMTYQQAVEYCKTLEIGGYGDWRLPTTNELLKLASSSNFKPNFKIHGMYWAYNPAGTDTDILEGVQFYDEGIVRHYGPTDKINVLAIKTRTVKW